MISPEFRNLKYLILDSHREISEIEKITMKFFIHLEKLKINHSTMEIIQLNNNTMVKEVCHMNRQEVSSSQQSLSSVFKIHMNTPQKKERFQIVHELGCGAFGTVYKAIDLKIFRTVAMKVSDDITTHRREYNFLKKCQDHPHIIQCYDAFKKGSDEESIEYCLSLEYADESLREFLKHRPCHYRTAKNILRQISLGVAFVHSLGFIHSDLKPDNIVVIHKNSDVLQVKLIDFGCVRKISQIPILYPGDTPESCVYFTTRWFRSPEVILNHVQYVNTGIDIWAIGCIAFQLITRRYLFCGANHEDMLSWYEFFLGRIPLEVLERNTTTYESYYCPSKTDEDTYYECDPEFTKKIKFHYTNELIQNRLTLTNNYVQEEHDLESIPHYSLKSRKVRECLFSQYSIVKHLQNPRCYLNNMITDVNYCQIMMAMLSYDPLLRPDAMRIAESLEGVATLV